MGWKMSLDAIMTEISKIEADIEGVKVVNDKAPATMNAFPQFVNFPAGSPKPIDRRPSARWITHSVIMELHVTDQVHPDAEALLRPFLERVLDAFDAKLTLNGSASNSQITNYKYGILTYNGQPHLGISFTLEATEIVPFAFAA